MLFYRNYGANCKVNMALIAVSGGGSFDFGAFIK